MKTLLTIGITSIVVGGTAFLAGVVAGIGLSATVQAEEEEAKRLAAH